MTLTEAQDHLRTALANGRQGCFVPVSAQALAAVLAELESNQGGDDDRGTA